jgi:hypothetical protein
VKNLFQSCVAYKFNVYRYTGEKEELHRRQALKVERQQAVQAAELNRVVAAGFERQESTMKVGFGIFTTLCCTQNTVQVDDSPRIVDDSPLNKSDTRECQLYVKDALEASARREEAALREVTKRAAEEAAKHAGGLERDLGAARAEANALREEVAASDATKHEVKVGLFTPGCQIRYMDILAINCCCVCLPYQACI